MTSRHSYHHGPKREAEGFSFRLYAPDSQTVTLLLKNDPPRELARGKDGWCELHVSAARPGDLYRFCVDGKPVPDPASRFQPEGIAGPSCLTDSGDFAWTDSAWQGRPWEETVLYELHTGCFTPEGTFKGVESKLDYLAQTGLTAIELMPIAQFAGERGWGYDGVLHYAPHNAYGTPDGLKSLVNEAHARGVMVMLDIVYNHFGPEGNYLKSYASDFFTDRYRTPWGDAVNFEGSRAVRQFFIENALYWIHEFHLDGLRFDAVHQIYDKSPQFILHEMAEAIRASLPPGRQVHLILENEHNQARLLTRDAKGAPRHYTAQWNDDIHHVLHVLATGEEGGYYADFKDQPLDRLGRCLAEGFDYQGEPSANRNGEKRGESSKELPPQAFVSFLQNHDQTGNRALGERLVTLAPSEKLTLALEIVVLAPQTPMLFMGEEWGSRTPFLYFCDFAEELAEAVRKGRSQEFASFFQAAGKDPASLSDPNASATFTASCLQWEDVEKPEGSAQRGFMGRLFAARARHIVPLVRSGIGEAKWRRSGEGGLEVRWDCPKGAFLQLTANFSPAPLVVSPATGEVIWGEPGDRLAPWKSVWLKGGKDA